MHVIQYLCKELSIQCPCYILTRLSNIRVVLKENFCLRPMIVVRTSVEKKTFKAFSIDYLGDFIN